MIGSTLSRYQILEELGAGGMGTVYRARDLRLRRDVAIKVLPAGALANEQDRKQIRGEALTLSQLNHPNIQTVHDFDSDQGLDFLVLELVPGETLSKRIAKGPLSEELITRIGLQLLDGLSAAHRVGILHRDIKPSNLQITPEGRLKILDFGLARLMKATGDRSQTRTVTSEQHIAGTLPYMAPEQIMGEHLDHRSDLYAVGAVFYEMACGRRAFPQKSEPAVIAAILSQPPEGLREIAPDVSPSLERITLRCLEKAPRNRYGSAEELAEDLRQLALPPPQRRAPKRAGPRRHPIRMAAIAAAFLAGFISLLFAVNPGGLRQRILKPGPPAALSIAVLPLMNLSGDPAQEFFVDGMTDELITRLAQVAALRVISRSSAMAYKGTKKPLRQIAKELDVGMVVEGSVMRSGDAVRISAQLIDALRDRNIWAESYERTLSNVLGMQSEVARAIVENVRARVSEDERVRLASAPAVNPKALESYLRGLAHFNAYTVEGNKAGSEEFKRAIAIDPTFAPAYAGLANCYFFMGTTDLPTEESVPRARAAAAKALELDPKLASPHAILGIASTYDREWIQSERGLRSAVRLNPGDVTAHQYLGAVLTALGRFEEAEKELSLAMKLDPLNSVVASWSVWPLFEGRQYRRAASAARRLIAADPKVWNSHMVLGQSLLFQGESKASLIELQEATKMDPENPFPLGWLGFGYAHAGDRTRAVQVLSRMQAWSRTGYVQPYLFALVYAGLGEKEKALDWLEKAIEARSDEIFFLKVDPGLDSLRSDPRFRALLAKMRFPA